MNTINNSKKGFALLGIVIALVVLGSMAAGISALVSANQKAQIASS